MCGIWGYIGKEHCVRELFDSFSNIQNRGPVRSEFVEINSEYPIYIGFHRLPIIESTVKGDQPFSYEENNRRAYLCCNGEIYNYKELIKEHNLPVKTPSDCEVILCLYLKYGIDKTIELINGEFAFMIYDADLNTNEFVVHLGRDQCGVRPMFYGISDNCFAFSSEAKGLTAAVGKAPKQIIDNVLPFPPRKRLELHFKIDDIMNGESQEEIKDNECKSVCGSFDLDHQMERVVRRKHQHKRLTLTHEFKEVLRFEDIKQVVEDEEIAKKMIRETLITCVEERLHGKVEMGALLSGGLDSSLVCAITARKLKEEGRKLKTFSVGMPGSTDRGFAEKVAKHIGSEHTHVEFSQGDFLKAIDEVIYLTESFDITTIRATAGQYLISRWIAQNTNIKMLLIGDGSDELCSGYMYFHKAPDAHTSHLENVRLLNNIHLYDGLRADRSIARNGMEARVPFLDLKFIKVFLSIKPELRVPRPHAHNKGKCLEKYLLRESFADTGLLPNEVLFRVKEAFSDGISSKERSWFSVIQEWVDKDISNEELAKAASEYKHLPPTSKESLHYRRKFEHFYGKGDICKITPSFWLPLWCGDIKDPSARVLKIYHEQQ